MTFKEKFEFENLQKEIPALEREKIELNEKINSGNIGYEELSKLLERLTEATKQLEEKELRWLGLSEYDQ